MDSLKELYDYKITYCYYYDLLVSVNSKIWEYTDKIKNMGCETADYGALANTIFNLNQSRFRLKNIINRFTDSNIQEQKSYSSTHIVVELGDDTNVDCEYFTNLSLEYDAVIIKCSDFAKALFESKVPKFNYSFSM